MHLRNEDSTPATGLQEHSQACQLPELPLQGSRKLEMPLTFQLFSCGTP